MLDEILNNPGLSKYLTRFDSEQIIFLEGDDSQDLYILVSGRVAIFKGDIKIRELTQKGALFGEMSFLLGRARTASIRTTTETSLLRIPREEIDAFLTEFPDAAGEITRHLARWLAETSQILYGLKEFCDQLPDAVLLTDRNGKILTWNSVAERLYGRTWEQMRNAHTAEIYTEPQRYNKFLKEVQEHYSAKENIFRIQHPQKGTRYISTSMTVLYDGHHNFQGVLSLGRDVTRSKNLEKKYKRVGYWLTAVLLLLGLSAGAGILGYRYLSQDHQSRKLRHEFMQNYLAKDYFVLRSLLGQHLAKANRSETSAILKNFFDIQQKKARIYTGLVVLDRQHIVVDAYSIDPQMDSDAMIGSSYGAIDFKASESSRHKVLVLYRSDPHHPMGKRGVEIAFDLQQYDGFIGWLVFQMNMDHLNKNLGIDLEDLRNLQIQMP